LGNDDGPRRADLCTALDGGGCGSAGIAVEVCAGGKPGVAGEEGGHVFSIGTTTVLDGRFAIVFTDSVGTCEGIMGRDPMPEKQEMI